MPVRGTIRPLELTALALIVSVGAYLRLTRLDLMEFKFDEATALQMAVALAEGRDWPLAGLMSSVGIHNPPVLIYLLAVPAFFSRDALFVAAAVAVLSSAAIGLAYRVLRPRFGPAIALGSALLLATSPWAVILGRKIWAQDLLVVPCTLLLHTLFVLIERPRSRVAGVVPPLLCVIAGLHFSGIALAPAALVVMLARRREMNWRAVVGGVVVATILIAPYALYLLEHGRHDVGAATRLTTRGVSLAAFPSPKIITYTIDLTGGMGWSYLLGDSLQAFTEGLGLMRVVAAAAHSFVGTLFVTGLVLIAWSALRQRPDGQGFLQRLTSSPAHVLLLWIASIWISSIAMRLQYAHPHYFVISYPVSFALAMLALQRGTQAAARAVGRIAAAVAATLVVVVAMIFALWTFSFLDFIEREGGTTGDYGVAYTHKRAAVEFARERHADVRSSSMPELPLLADLAAGAESSAGVATLYVENGLVTPVRTECMGESRTFGPLQTCLVR
jgi:hypothetical protein